MNYKRLMRSADATSPDDLLTTREVADRARVSTVTVTRWMHDGRLTGIKVGPRTFRYRRSDVEALLAPSDPEQASA
jgi:excisionase family DNA binding protein